MTYSGGGPVPPLLPLILRHYDHAQALVLRSFGCGKEEEEVQLARPIITHRTPADAPHLFLLLRFSSQGDRPRANAMV